MTSDTVIWHDVECAAYDIDLAPWRELAGAAGGAVLDIGCCTGRVALANPYGGIDDTDWVPPYPDMLDVDGVVYASTPLAVRRDGEGAAVDRKRQIVSPKGEVSEWITTLVIDLVTADEVEAEAADLGFTALERGWIP